MINTNLCHFQDQRIDKEKRSMAEDKEEDEAKLSPDVSQTSFKNSYIL